MAKHKDSCVYFECGQSDVSRPPLCGLQNPLRFPHPFLRSWLTLRFFFKMARPPSAQSESMIIGGTILLGLVCCLHHRWPCRELYVRDHPVADVGCVPSFTGVGYCIQVGPSHRGLGRYHIRMEPRVIEHNGGTTAVVPHGQCNKLYSGGMFDGHTEAVPRISWYG